MSRRRSRADQSEESGSITSAITKINTDRSSEILVSQTPHQQHRHHNDERIMPQRKKRRTILESLQTMSLKSTSNHSNAGCCDSSDDEGNSSCATGGSLLHDDGNHYGDEESMGSGTDEEEDVLLSDQEKVHRDIMYQLATGKTRSDQQIDGTSSNQRQDVVQDRIEQMIRQSRLRAAAALAVAKSTDDFDVAVRRSSSNTLMMDMDVEPSLLQLKRSNSLPGNVGGPTEARPPLETIEVEIEAEV